MLPISDSETPASSAFLTFLRHAAAARQNGTAQAEANWLDAAAQRHPLDDESIDSLIITLLEQHRHNDAIELAAIIAQLDPHRALTHFRFGYALQMANRHNEAIAPYRRALAIDPTLPQLRNNLAGALTHTGGALNEQIALLESAVHHDPSHADAWTNLTQASRANLNLPRALEAGARAVQCAPHSPLAHNNYALALREAQRWDEAEHAERTACALAPNDATVRSNLSMLQLMRGNYAHGWQTHEARWDGSFELNGNRPAFPAPTWQGEALAGKTLLVWGEQGMGDVLQFSRYIPLLAERAHCEGGRLVWNSFPQMGALLARSLGDHVDGYSAGGGVESLPPFDYEIPLLSLPLMFNTREETIPAATPYLRADAAAGESWRARLAGETRLKVGLAWTGSHGHQRNPFRRVGWEHARRGVLFVATGCRSRRCGGPGDGSAHVGLHGRIRQLRRHCRVCQRARSRHYGLHVRGASEWRTRPAHMGAARRQPALGLAARPPRQPVVSERDTLPAAAVRPMGSGAGGRCT
jgi:Flp pilus assembly protein TadD